jgi:5-methylcytosine-specific restriction endonuclease McrA
MARLTFSSDGRRVKGDVRKEPGTSGRSADDVVRGIKEEAKKPPGEDYRERSLRIHGLVCAHCGRVFDEANRHLLTVHHRDGNHRNNPPDGSNWENLCVYCHENTHSREVLGEYLGGAGAMDRARPVVSGGGGEGFGLLAKKLEKAMKNKSK